MFQLVDTDAMELQGDAEWLERHVSARLEANPSPQCTPRPSTQQAAPFSSPSIFLSSKVLSFVDAGNSFSLIRSSDCSMFLEAICSSSPFNEMEDYQ
jgi:hypothetical protein